MGRACSTNEGEEECIQVENPEGKRPAGGARYMRVDNIKMDLR
jgi:hypothetical protein